MTTRLQLRNNIVRCLQPLAYWIGYTNEVNRGETIPELAIGAKLFSLLQSVKPTGYVVKSELATSKLLQPNHKIERPGNVDICMHKRGKPRGTPNHPTVVIELKKYCRPGVLHKDLKRLSGLRKSLSGDPLTISIVTNQNKVPDYFLRKYGRSDYAFKGKRDIIGCELTHKFYVRRVCKALSTNYLIQSKNKTTKKATQKIGHFVTLLEVI
ncbi:MAG: hypothetical protein ACI9JK_001300 [Phycisphaerales bacterium]|jgi:hypothetical protein